MRDLDYLVGKSGVRYLKARKRIVLEPDDLVFLKDAKEYFNGLASAGIITTDEAQAKIEKTPDFVLAIGSAGKKNKGTVEAVTPQG